MAGCPPGQRTPRRRSISPWCPPACDFISAQYEGKRRSRQARPYGTALHDLVIVLPGVKPVLSTRRPCSVDRAHRDFFGCRISQVGQSRRLWNDRLRLSAGMSVPGDRTDIACRPVSVFGPLADLGSRPADVRSLGPDRHRRQHSSGSRRQRHQRDLDGCGYPGWPRAAAVIRSGFIDRKG